jgi:hypothetical protein
MGRHGLQCVAVGLAASALFAFAGPLVASAHADAAPAPVPADPGLATQNGKVNFRLYVPAGVRVDVVRKWDSWNNCVEQDGTEYRNHLPASTLIGNQYYGVVYMSVTVKNDGSCAYERSRMHWDVALPGYKHGAANISIGQPMAGTGYYTGCEGTFGDVKCTALRTPTSNLLDPHVH